MHLTCIAKALKADIEFPIEECKPDAQGTRIYREKLIITFAHIDGRSYSGPSRCYWLDKTLQNAG